MLWAGLRRQLYAGRRLAAAFALDVEVVDNVQEGVAEETFRAREVAFYGCDHVVFRGALPQHVHPFEAHGERLAAQESLRDVEVPEPLVVVEQVVIVAPLPVEVDSVDVYPVGSRVFQVRVVAADVHSSLLSVMGRSVSSSGRLLSPWYLIA